MLRRSVWVVSILVASMLGAIFGPALASAVVPGAVSADEALVYVPVVPCKVFAGVQLDGEGSGDVETVDVAGVPGSANQNQDVCALTAAPADAVAVSLNLIAQSVKARGNLQIGPSGGNTESVVNYVNTVDMNNSTELTVEVDSNGEIDLQAGGGATVGIANVVTAKGVLLGYYVPGDSVYESFDRTVVVGGSGTDAENGAALLAAITAVNAQSPSGADPWLIKLEAGTFNLSGGSATIGDGVNLKGSGIGVTVITSATASPPIVVSAGSTSIAELTAESTITGSALVTSSAVLHANNVHLRADKYPVQLAGGEFVGDSLIIEGFGPAGGDKDLINTSAGATAFVTGSTFLGSETSDGLLYANAGTTLTVVNSYIEDTTAVANAGGLVTCRAISNPTTFLPTTCN